MRPDSAPVAHAPQTAEEYYSQALDRVHVLAEQSRAHAQRGEVVEAVACQWAADVATVQAAAWERIVVVSRTAQRALFDLGERVLADMQALPAAAASGADAAELLEGRRRSLVESVDPSLAEDVGERWASLDHLRGFPAPDAAAYGTHARIRLGGLEPGEYVAGRLAESAAAMSRSREARVRGDLAEAIETAYQSDMLALDAYLVSTAEALGDHALLTAVVRWDLATSAVMRMSAVPQDVQGAIAAVRLAVGAILGTQEAARLETCWQSPA